MKNLNKSIEQEKSQCCGGQKMIQERFGISSFICGMCDKPFIPQAKVLANSEDVAPTPSPSTEKHKLDCICSKCEKSEITHADECTCDRCSVSPSTGWEETKLKNYAIYMQMLTPEAATEFLKHLLSSQQNELRSKIEGMKGWNSCLVHEGFKHPACISCTERETINQTLDDILALIPSNSTFEINLICPKCGHPGTCGCPLKIVPPKE